jgi:glycosyltransferase involved in cell wall biosynthesis
MKINFILPSFGNNPIGGFKVVYEYANRLVASGNIVNVIHPLLLQKHDSLYRQTRSYGRYLISKFDKSYRPDSWFTLDSRVNVLMVPFLSEKYIPNADFLIATAWYTTKPLAYLSNRKGKKYYIIQNYEIWAGEKNEILSSFRLPFKKIVISHWLEKLVNSQGEDAFYIPNGFDFKAFGIDVRPEDRNNSTIMMLYHKLHFKCSNFGLRAIKKVKDVIPNLKLILFSVYPPPEKLPEWISFYHQTEQSTLRSLYNESAIFISPSILEGFALPPAEAMLSGCALIASDIGGHREYAISNSTALLFPPKDIRKLIDNICLLIDNNTFRIKLAYDGHNFIKQFSWEKSSNNLETILKNDL